MSGSSLLLLFKARRVALPSHSHDEAATTTCWRGGAGEVLWRGVGEVLSGGRVGRGFGESGGGG